MVSLETNSVVIQIPKTGFPIDSLYMMYGHLVIERSQIRCEVSNNTMNPEASRIEGVLVPSC